MRKKVCQYCGNKKVSNYMHGIPERPLAPPDPPHDPLQGIMDNCLSDIVNSAKDMLKAINEARLELKTYLDEDYGYLSNEAQEHLNHLSALEDAAQEIEGYIDHNY